MINQAPVGWPIQRRWRTGIILAGWLCLIGAVLAWYREVPKTADGTPPPLVPGKPIPPEWMGKNLDLRDGARHRDVPDLAAGPNGAIFETTELPELAIRIESSAPLKRGTLVRNEENYQFLPLDGRAELDLTYTDDTPQTGENRYYIRVEQEDGNMAWSSPIWVSWNVEK